MTTRRSLLAPLVSLAGICLAFLAPALRAQDSTAADIENSKYQFTGVVNSNAVFVRSGPSENDYATMKLDKGVEVTVVGLRFEWLKVKPPEGSFCYVAKAYVNRAGNGSIGQVSTTLYVRVGSSLNPLKTKVAMKLEPTQRVEIIGEQDEYFKVKPPEGVYYYINKQFVDPVRKVTDVAIATPDTSAANATVAPAGSDPVAAEANPQPAAELPAADSGTPVAVAPTTQPDATIADATSTTRPATQPTASAETEFERLEATYAQISQKPLDEQPVEELLTGYRALAASDGLPESMRRICDWKANVLKTRAEAKNDLVGAKKLQDGMKQKQMALQAERSELEERVKKADVQFYTAVGTLRTSSLQQGQQTLYRLTDPANGRTVVYLRSDDTKLGQFIGQFIGVRGEVVSDTQLSLRLVTPTAYEVVNPAKVGQSVAAQIVPPSLLPAGTASTGGE